MLMLGELSALYSPVRANAVLDPYGLALTGFMLPVAWKAPPWIVVSWWAGGASLSKERRLSLRQ